MLANRSILELVSFGAAHLLKLQLQRLFAITYFCHLFWVNYREDGVGDCVVRAGEVLSTAKMKNS